MTRDLIALPPGVAPLVDSPRRFSFSRGVTGPATPRRVRPREDSGSTCLACEEAFSLLRGGRKHCRRCGGAFHADCLPHRLPLPDMLYTEAQPVCESCKERLDQEVVVSASPRRKPGGDNQWLQLRRDPGESSAAESSVAAGARLTVEEERGVWMLVRRRAAVGWVLRRDVEVEGCNENCNTTHDWDGECRRCGQRWAQHGKGHACPGGGRGSWAAVDRVVDRNCRIVVASWNVGESDPPQSEEDMAVMRRMLHVEPGDPEEPDVIAVGLQEIDMGRQAMVAGETDRAEPWQRALQEAVGLQMGLVHAQQLGGVMMVVFTRRPAQRRRGGGFAASGGGAAAWIAEDVRDGYVRRGAGGGLLANKGAVGVRVRLHRSTIAFVNAHLAAHQHAVEQRNADFQGILDDMVFEDDDGEAAGLLDTDRVFFFGDLNYRIDHTYAETVKMSHAGDFQPLLDRDQLQIEMKKPLSPYFRLHWKEAVPCFAPTYKYDVGTDDYDTSEKRRVPAWCDRVLWWARPYGNRLWGLAVGGRKVRRAAAIMVDGPGEGEGALKDPVSLREFKRAELRQSDHRPVCGTFDVTLSVPADGAQVSEAAMQSSFTMASARRLKQRAVAFYNPNAKWGQLSTFHIGPFTDSSRRRWRSLEHWYQAHKYEGTPGFEAIRDVPTPELAYEQGRRPRGDWGPLRKDWDSAREDVMLRGATMKFEQNAVCRSVLLSTGTRPLRFRDADDGYWGSGPEGDGRNRLGALLERVRDELRSREDKPVVFLPDGTGAAPELSPAHSCRFSARGVRWESVLHFYHAHKFPESSAAFAAVQQAATPAEAQQLAREERFASSRREDWDTVREGVMQEALAAKHGADSASRRALLNTATRPLQLNDSDDGYWGMGDGGGANHYGRLLEKVREDLNWIRADEEDEEAAAVKRCGSAATSVARPDPDVPAPAPELMVMGGRVRRASPVHPLDLSAMRHQKTRFRRADLRPGLLGCFEHGAASCLSMLFCFPCHLGSLIGNLSDIYDLLPPRVAAALCCCPCATCLARDRLVEKTGKEEDIVVTLLMGFCCFPCVYFQSVQVGWREKHIVPQPWQLRTCCSSGGGKTRAPSPDHHFPPPALPAAVQQPADNSDSVFGDHIATRAPSMASFSGSVTKQSNAVSFTVPEVLAESRTTGATYGRRRASMWQPEGAPSLSADSQKQSAVAFSGLDPADDDEEVLGGFSFGARAATNASGGGSSAAGTRRSSGVSTSRPRAATREGVSWSALSLPEPSVQSTSRPRAATRDDLGWSALSAPPEQSMESSRQNSASSKSLARQSPPPPQPPPQQLSPQSPPQQPPLPMEPPGGVAEHAPLPMPPITQNGPIMLNGRKPVAVRHLGTGSPGRPRQGRGAPPVSIPLPPRTLTSTAPRLPAGARRRIPSPAPRGSTQPPVAAAGRGWALSQHARPQAAPQATTWDWQAAAPASPSARSPYQPIASGDPRERVAVSAGFPADFTAAAGGARWYM
eukprot:TRINITY_DN20146_c0_g1_i1.p1 TRINITY_DN20146_c0_g1~~TRINITY_DN20146_c0_g1_i1.p1  ORF type:complete len:1491 (+),score=312.80 TRINITY_DN20146_c0_g1_i1:61-4533(+)